MKKLRLIGMISAAALALVMVVSATGCGNDSSSSKSSSSSSKSASQDKDSKSDDSNNSDDATMSQEEWEEFQKSDENQEFMDEQKAGQNAIAGAEDQIGEGDWRIVSTEKSKSPGDGFDCWKIGVVNYADSQSPTYYFYCGDQFCILEQ